MLKKLGLSIAAAVACLAAPAGAQEFPNDGQIIIKNQSGFTVGVSTQDSDFFFVVPPKRKARLRNVSRTQEVLVDFDGDNDGLVDATYGVQLLGGKKATHTIGDFGLLGILN